MQTPARNNLPTVRRFEAAGFRAWPAEVVRYDGSWQIRQSPGNLTKRANCLVPLDPGDTGNIEQRLAAIEASFAAADIPFVVKETPLCAPDVNAVLEKNGFVAEAESIVQTMRLEGSQIDAGVDLLPSQDAVLFADACAEIDSKFARSYDAMLRMIEAIEPEKGMFFTEHEGAGVQAVTLCVRDGNLAGLQQVAVLPEMRHKGIGLAITAGALRWAKLRGALTAWLQVEASNEAGIALYKKLGFEEAYRYRYWRRAKI
ncbi:GNAT family N-acetyltransferase [Rhizobium sp. L1K21]|uniref:GNAT family N-acetyltransferase n=1 Tax=Rhizobium sp. L1K21 TaxID=2954933 RepID=UPI0020934EAB|nr:GNAT family N-acetyltransferase [Rhizobium sp. L1K21]MCO6188197.1 GNAT family N-acetyltransferase [Rhizobium sp. L1K21]